MCIRDSENTAWSCAHGVARWNSDCSCNTGGNGDWNQQWRGPLREALDWLRDEVAPKYEQKLGELLKDPWTPRNEYIAVVFDRSPDCRQGFLQAYSRCKLTLPEQVNVWKLLELQRHAMLMYTSCGWFFNDISGIEPIQILKYAARVIDLMYQLDLPSPRERFLEILAEAKSNRPEKGNGAEIYQQLVEPANPSLSSQLDNVAETLAR